MEWYYAAGTERKGPVAEAEFEGLVQQGLIHADTLVWREGMAQWQAYSAISAGAAPDSSIPPMIASKCDECQRPMASDDLVQINGRSICAECKPLALQRMREGVIFADTNAESVRQAHISHEASIKSLGILYYIGSAFCLMACFGMGFAATQSSPARDFSFVLPLAFVYLALGFIAGWTGHGIRKLKRSARIAAGVLAAIGLLNIPIGTLINGYILYLLFSAKGKTVFSDDYQRVIAATPHIKYRTSILVWVILIAIVVVLLAIAIPAIVRR